MLISGVLRANHFLDDEAALLVGLGDDEPDAWHRVLDGRRAHLPSEGYSRGSEPVVRRNPMAARARRHGRGAHSELLVLEQRPPLATAAAVATAAAAATARRLHVKPTRSLSPHDAVAVDVGPVTGGDEMGCRNRSSARSSVLSGHQHTALHGNHLSTGRDEIGGGSGRLVCRSSGTPWISCTTKAGNIRVPVNESATRRKARRPCGP